MLDAEHSRLKNFPVNFLAVLLGLMGYSLALQKAEEIINFPVSLYSAFLYLTIILFIGFIVLYLAKFFKYPTDVQNEFRHPIKANFYPILAKLFLILSVIYIPLDTQLSKYFWFIGVILQFTFSVVMMYIWISHTKFEIHHLKCIMVHSDRGKCDYSHCRGTSRVRRDFMVLFQYRPGHVDDTVYHRV